MPLAQLYIGPGRSQEVKQKLIENVTLAIKDAMGPLKQPVWVVINEVPLKQWGVDGVPVQSSVDS
jgi:4-oxalocrotonate tautomerase